MSHQTFMSFLMIMCISTRRGKFQHTSQDHIEILMHQLTLIHRYNRHKMLFLVHAQSHRTILFHIAKGVFHLVTIPVARRCSLNGKQLTVTNILLVKKPLDLSKFIAQLLFIGHTLIDAAATNIFISADFSKFHIFHLKSPVAVIKFFLVFQEPIFLDGFTNTSHGVDKKMQIVCRHQHG